MKLKRFLGKYALYIAFVQAWAAVLGSLYFSEVAGLRPCLLCWYQRILMYPLALLFAVAIWRNDKKVYFYALPFSFLGAIVGFYQYLLQMTPLQTFAPTACNAYESCSKIDFIALGFITIPFLSFMAFVVISLMMIFLIKFGGKK